MNLEVGRYVFFGVGVGTGVGVMAGVRVGTGVAGLPGVRVGTGVRLDGDGLGDGHGCDPRTFHE